MYKIAAAIIIMLTCLFTVTSQVKDSIYSGRVCIIILKNGFEADGIITDVKQDTIWFRDEYGEYRVPIEQIKFVNDVNENAEEIILPVQKPGKTEECNLYLETGSVYKNVRLFPYNDSNVLILKGETEKIQLISQIRKLEYRGPGFGKGFLIGAGVGFASGLLLGLTWPEHGDIKRPDFGQSMLIGLIFSLPSGLIGGIIGEIFRTDQKYLLPPGYSKIKSKRLNYIMIKHKE